MGFEGRVAIVTGSGSKKGIGREIALCLAERGANLVIADMNLEGAKEVAEEVKKLGRKAIAAMVNVTDSKTVDAMVDATLKEFGRVDILVNNAGITQPVKTIDMTEADFDRVVSINLKGTFICSKAVLKPMIERKYGRIVSISSVSGKQGGGVYGGSHYSASKAGILGFSKCLAREQVSNGITVNCVAPGLVATEIRAGYPEDKERALWEAIPMQRPATPREIANAVAFLASDDATYITGEDIDVNGGSHMD
jgi:3-oxoacyl-[acyl-carrier protein] reductase